MSTADHPHELQIFVNTRPKKAPGPTISFAEVLALAGIDTVNQDISLYDIDWTKGNKTGSLTPGQSVDLENGMKFDAGKSNRS